MSQPVCQYVLYDGHTGMLHVVVMRQRLPTAAAAIGSGDA
jgi:hypothetical protein